MGRIICLTITSILIIASCTTVTQHETAFYVSPDGDDTANGKSADNAFATLERARNAICDLKKSDEIAAPVNVYLREGLHNLAEPMILTPEDSGTDENPVTWKAYPGENPVITGASVVSGWQKAENGLWRVSLPEVASGDLYFSTLYVNGTPRPRTRLPKEGYYSIVDFPSKGKDPWAAPGDHFVFSPGDIKKDWKNIVDAEVVVLRFWVSSRQHIESVDESSNTVQFNCQTRYRYSDDFTDKGARYYVENVFEGLDDPGEWYLDRPTGTLFYYPKSGEDMNTVLVEIPVSPQLIRFEGEPSRQSFVTNVTFEGITFTHNNWMLPEGNPGDGQSAPEVEGALFLRGAIDCGFIDCRIVQLSSYAIQIDEGCRNNSFIGNELGHLGGGGFRIGGGDAKSHPDMRTGWNTITDNHIHHIGEIYHAATGVWIQHSGGNLISHNEIDHTYYSSMAIGWVWGYRPSVTTHNEISYIHIHHVGQGVLSDMGGIYMLGVAPGTIVRNNLIHDIESHGYGGWGIYTDEGSTHVLIENNIVYNTKCAGFDQHYGRENFVRNNIFAFGREDQIHRSRIDEHISFYIERNIIYYRGENPLLGGRWDKITYIHRPGKPWAPAQPDSVTHVFDYNLYFNPDKNISDIRFDKWTFDEWKTGGQDTHSSYADPLFADPDNGDFTLSADSPAFALGFQKIDMSTVGPRK
ncbi:right-handed parallel beta-helix repeat-containing protein [Candidatus Latescibacterota bacterium]